MLRLSNCNIHNLQNVAADIPLGLMIGVAGVSGSGKSSLISDTLVPKLKELLKIKLVLDDDEDEADEGENNTEAQLSGKSYGELVEEIVKNL
jgi:excinuclease UvrABC ATPase subunit